MSTILIVSDDERIVATVDAAARGMHNCRTRWVSGLKELGSNLADSSVDLIILHVDDRARPEELELEIRRLVDRQPRLATLLVCDRNNAERELHFLRLGVSDCLTRPLDTQRLTFLISSLTLRKRMQSSRGASKQQDNSYFDTIYRAAAPAMQRVLDSALRIASKDVPILLCGETGTGKTHLARLIHGVSRRESRPFVALNCGALSTSLIDSELFGHQKGAFTGADGDRDGKFAHAQDGTLLLDEIDALTLPAQAKLLRVLDERVFERLGSNKTIPLTARLIVASNRSLEDAVAQGEFRTDLFYRLNVIRLEIPPLRQRKCEIRPLVELLVEQLANDQDLPVPQIDEPALKLLQEHTWPGNIRELRNALECALALGSGGTIHVSDLPEHLTMRRGLADEASAPPNVPLQAVETLAQARKQGEYRRLVDVLQRCENNRSQAAKVLGISRTALYKKLVTFGI